MLVIQDPTVCFNTQPPEGGWHLYSNTRGLKAGFNTQPPEGGWPVYYRK